MKEVFKEIQRLDKLEPTPKEKKLCKLFEEAGELARAVNKSIGKKDIKSDEDDITIRDNVCEEAADTIQCTISMINSYGISLEELIDKVKDKNKVWEKQILKRIK